MTDEKPDDWEIYDEKDRLGLVHCDENCDALVKPVSDMEHVRAYRHWRFHSWTGGCSHGH